MDSPFSDCPTSMRAISTHDVTRPPPRLVRVESHADAARLLNPSHSSDGCGLTFSAGTSACRFADLLLLPGGTDQGAELLGRIQRDPGAGAHEPDPRRREPLQSDFFGCQYQFRSAGAWLQHRREREIEPGDREAEPVAKEDHRR